MILLKWKTKRETAKALRYGGSHFHTSKTLRKVRSYKPSIGVERSITMDSKTFKTERLQLGLSQTDMATRLGVCLRTIGYYEAGEKPIPDSIRLLHNCLKRKVILEKDIELAKERG